MSKKYVNIALNIPINKLFSYQVPESYSSINLIGRRVIVEFNRRIMTGIIVEEAFETKLKYIKSIKSVTDTEQIIPEELLKLCKWISEYYRSPIGELVHQIVPKGLKLTIETHYLLTNQYKERLDELTSEKDEVILDVVKIFEKKPNKSLTRKQIEKKIPLKNLERVINKMVQYGILQTGALPSVIKREKYVPIIIRNFNPADFEYVITDNKVKGAKQQELLGYFRDVEEVKLSVLYKLFPKSYSAVKSLVKKNLLVVEEIKEDREYDVTLVEDEKEITLNAEQVNCLSSLEQGLLSKEFRTYLLYGVTGSGKTEIYLNISKYVLESGKSIIILVPEISLTPQLISRFRNRLGNNIGVIHSRLNPYERADTFRRCIKGEYKIIIGARSALFAPIRNIGLIVVDEEHDSSYKQDNSPRYNARDAAIVRGSINNAIVILGSATPSLESYYNAEQGKYKLLTLEKRATNITLPSIQIVDLLEKSKKIEKGEYVFDIMDMIDKVKVKFLSYDLLYEIGERLSRKESTIILQNRKGFYFYLECVNCGNVEKCKHCNVTLTYHKSWNLLKCHYCGYVTKIVNECSVCHYKKLVPKGAGTEKVEEELQKIFTEATIKRLDADIMSSRKNFQSILQDFYDRKIDILVGTQVISKGLDFPNVTLVGVINADIGLLHPDFRANERTFQILTQVAGRSGRQDKKGKVIIQTNHSDYSVFKYIKEHNYVGFYKNELETRKKLNYPPFSRITIIEMKSKNLDICKKSIGELYEFLRTNDRENKLQILPPVQPLFSKLKDYYRYNIVIKASKAYDPNAIYLRKVLKLAEDYIEKARRTDVKVNIDVDALNLL
ncbi:MAG: replication restart helicase PriA [Ignavibacteria bacterium]